MIIIAIYEDLWQNNHNKSTGGTVMKKDNPFTLTFVRQPTEYINRYENMDSIISTFEADNPISQSFLIEGIRGSGKTVLLIF